MKKITSIILIAVFTIIMSINAFATSSVTANGVTLTLEEPTATTRSSNSTADEVWYTMSRSTFSQSGILKVWVEQDGEIVSDVSTRVTHGGGMMAGKNRLKLTDNSATMSRSAMQLKTSFTPAQDYKIYNPMGKMQDGSKSNVVAITNGYMFSFDVGGGRVGSATVGHLNDAENSYWMVAGLPIKPEVTITKADEYWPDPVDTKSVGGTFTITMSSVKGNWSNTITVEVDSSGKLVDTKYTNYATLSMDSSEKPFVMPSQQVDDIKVSISFKAA